MGINDSDLGKSIVRMQHTLGLILSLTLALVIMMEKCPLICCTMPVFFPASRIYELADGKENTMDFAEAIDQSDLEEFGFTDSFIFELWGAVTDANAGRLE